MEDEDEEKELELLKLLVDADLVEGGGGANPLLGDVRKAGALIKGNCVPAFSCDCWKAGCGGGWNCWGACLC